jgi:hypothetical protein
LLIEQSHENYGELTICTRVVQSTRRKKRITEGANAHLYNDRAPGDRLASWFLNEDLA